MFSWFWLQIISIPLGTMTLPSFRFTIQTLFVLKQMYTLKTSDGRFSVWISLSIWIPGFLICLLVFKTWNMPLLCQSFKSITLKNFANDFPQKLCKLPIHVCCLFFLDCVRQVDGGTKCRHWTICQKDLCALAATPIVKWCNLETHSCSCHQYSTRFWTAKSP